MAKTQNRSARISALKLRRQALGYTLSELSQLVGVSMQRIHHFEKGLIPLEKHREPYARALKMSVEKLMDCVEGRASVKVSFE